MSEETKQDLIYPGFEKASGEEKKDIEISDTTKHPTEVSRRDFLRLGAIAAGASLAQLDSGGPVEAASSSADVIVEATIAELQAAMASGELTARQLVDRYIARIRDLDQNGPKVNSVIEVNPDARSIADGLDAERTAGQVRGPLHGIPILLKDNIDTSDRMQTAAGSLALVGTPPVVDSTVAQRLRNAGAILLGKANLSEWANFRSARSSSGWSGRGGQCRNPYALNKNPCGSSSGSAAAVAANFCAAALGTETDGSIVCPSNHNAVVGIKPTVGLTSRAGVVPISHTQDTVGPHGRTVADAATVLGALTGVDPRDPATQRSAGKFFTDYTQFLDPDGLRGARIGVARNLDVGFTGYSEHTDRVFEASITAMSAAGAVIIDPADIPNVAQIFDPEFAVLIYEFPRDLAAYLAPRIGVPIRNLNDAIAFNIANAGRELLFFLQELFDLCALDPITQDAYVAALQTGRMFSRKQGINAVMAQHNLDALVSPTGSPPWSTDLIDGDHFLGASSTPCAVAGYPIINVPSGFVFGLPLGISFMGTAFSEPTLIKLASGFEAVTQVRRPPEFRSVSTLDSAPFPSGPRKSSHRSALDLKDLKQARRVFRFHSL